MLRFVSRLCVPALVLLLCQPSFAAERDMARGISDAQLAELGQRWATALNESDVPALSRVLDLEALGFRSAESFTENQTERNDFVRGFMRGAERFSQTLIGQIDAVQGHALFLKVHSFEGMRGPLVRYDLGDQGFNYILLIAESRAGAAPRVVDMYVATNGQRLTDTMGALSQLLLSPSNSLLGKLFGLNSIDGNLAQTFKDLGQLQREGKSAEAYATLQKLPETVRNHRVMMNISVQLAGLVGEDAYREELTRLARYHRDDPTAAFALVDYYFLKGDMQSAMEGILALERAFGADAAIAMMKTNAALENGELTPARRYAEEGVDLEPDNEAARWTLLTVLMLAEEYAGGIEVLQSLEREFGYTFDDTSFVDNDLYADFVRSREYADWLEAHP